jgi:FkbM family methyltransferase
MFYIALVYSFIYGFVKDLFSINLRGLGFFLRHVKKDRILRLKGFKLYFNSSLSEAYARQIHGEWNEPETHFFINRISNNKPFYFIEVGANIGEILIDVSKFKNCISCWAFEPNPEAYRVIQINNLINDINNVTVIKKAVGEKNGSISINFKGHSPSVSLLDANIGDSNLYEIVDLTTIDYELLENNFEENLVIMLIDVEGFELKVLKGATKFITKFKPIIIFEFHDETKKVFNVEEVLEVVGLEYKIFKIDRNAKLHEDLSNSWNCVLVPDSRLPLNIA